MHFERKNASQRGPASKVRALEIKPCVDAWDRSIQTRTHRYAAIACFKFDRHPKNIGRAYIHLARIEGNCRAICGSLSHCPKSEPSINPIPNLFLAHPPGKMTWLHVMHDAMYGCSRSHNFHGHAIMWSLCRGLRANIFRGSRLPHLNSRKKEALFAGFQ